MEVFKTNDYQKSPSLEAQHRPRGPAWDSILLLYSPQLLV